MFKATLLTLLIFNTIIAYSQGKRPLPIVKSEKDTLDIRYNNYLDEKSWILSEKKKIDILNLPIDDSTVVTFISGIDSISFTVKPGEKYDFLISKGAKTYYTRIQGTQDHSRITDSLAEINFKCLKTNLLSVKQRGRNYPFNKAAKIELISFIDMVKNFTTPIPVKNKKLEQTKVREQRSLNDEQINELTNILYNIGRTPIPNLRYTITSSATCYEPRNGIIFINSRGDIFEYIEICFGCRKSRISSRKVKFGDTCEQKYDILRDFFIKNGLEFGTKDD